MNYYQVNVNYLDNGHEFTTQQCFPVEGAPLAVQMKLKRYIKGYTEETVRPLGGEIKSVKTKRVTKKYYEANKQLKIYEGEN
ncbi:hypothetical protein CN425_18670 [Bacillus cereus]|uniref:Uncharacterized protein n=1 Tax=Bacillus cereus TaxID=1396 RepID=A0A2A8PU88_BACCE|nr:hypothetical protein [Bacillus cereus]PEV99793.1 hypothetical protein CN425_18670 [Bacillus cereus]